MTIREMLRQGFHYARTCKSLWLFGFVVGMASGGSSGGTGGGEGGGGTDGFGLVFAPSTMAVLIAVAVLAIVAAIVIRFVSEGALVEGVAQARHGSRMTFLEALTAGWSHWGVLVRIAVVYFAASAASLALLAAPPVLALRLGSGAAAIALAIPAVTVAVPWLITLYLVQAFASRIAILENRHALDAIAKARLFLHGRLRHGLKLLVASFLGSVLVAVVAIVAILPVVFLLVSLIPSVGMMPLIVIGAVVLLPAGYVLTAVLGTFRSAVWTIGYVSQVDA